MNILTILIVVIVIETIILIGYIYASRNNGKEIIENRRDIHDLDEQLNEIKNICELFVDNSETTILEKYNTYTKVEQIENSLKENSFKSPLTKKLLKKIIDDTKLIKKYEKDLEILDQLKEEMEIMTSGNKTALPYLAGIVADKETLQLELMAKSLDWGYDEKRMKKVKDIRLIRKEAKEEIEKSRIATYQLAYLLELYPELEDVLDTDYKDLDLSHDYLSEGDPTRHFLSKEEWESLSESERNQLALDKYIESHSKSKWQIGRDYELYVGYEYLRKGFKVEYYGSNKGMEDLGRDLICKKGNKTQIIQCKYWSKDKEIREKHIFQLYGTTLVYCIEKNLSIDSVVPVFVTNTRLSSMARQVAEQLGVVTSEHHKMGEYPRIKCHIGKDDKGMKTKIYHLPMDQQYDKIKMDKKDSFFVFTVKEAEDKGFRRAYKWYGN